MSKKGALFFLSVWVAFFMCFFNGVAAAADGGVVLVLSGGGIRGLAHIGVIKALEERNVPVVGIVGTSMGSLVGALASCGYDAPQLEKIIGDIDLTELLYDRTAPSKMAIGERALAEQQTLLRIDMDKSWRVEGPKGAMQGKRLIERFARWTSVCPVNNFDNLPVPFAAVATDLVSGEAVVIRQGDLASAMRASMSIPGLFEPWEMDGRLLVDGGLAANLPVRIAKKIFPNHPIVAVDVTGKGKSKEEIRTVMDVIDQSITVMTRRTVEEDARYADVLITPDVSKVSILSTRGWDEIIERGYIAAADKMPEVLALFGGGGVAKAGRMRPEKPVVESIAIEGIGGEVAKEILESCEDCIGKPLDVSRLQEVCRSLREREGIKEASYVVQRKTSSTAKVIIKVEKEPPYQFVLSGYASNLSPNRQLYGDLFMRDVVYEGDVLYVKTGIGENWGAQVGYLGIIDDESMRFGLDLFALKEEYQPEGLGAYEWKKYGLTVGEYIKTGELRWYLGYKMGEARYEGENHSFHGPSIGIAWDNRDDPIDPEKGTEINVAGWLEDNSMLLGRVEVRSILPLGQSSKVIFRGGAILGDQGRPWFSAYLGAKNELYSRAYHPLKGENAAWAGLTYRKALTESWWGRVYVDLFATGGRVYPEDWEDAREVWETGLAVTLPGKILDGKIFVVYDDEGDWSFGYSLGSPRDYGELVYP